MKAHSGFTLIEVLVGILIASFVSGVVLTTIFQLQKILGLTDRLIGYDNRFLLVAQQLERDLSGAFVPSFVATTTQKSTQQESKKALDSLSEKVFYGTARSDGSLEILTFLTSNPLSMYGATKPRVARVVYRLQEDEKDKNAAQEKKSFTLMRQESTENLSFDAFTSKASKAIRMYPIVSGIKSLTVTYLEEKQNEQNNKQPNAQPVGKEYDKLKEWVRQEQSKKEQEGVATQASSSAQKKPDAQQLAEGRKKKKPDLVELTLSLWDIDKRGFKTLTSTIALATTELVQRTPAPTSDIKATSTTSPEPQAAHADRNKQPSTQRTVAAANKLTPRRG